MPPPAAAAAPGPGGSVSKKKTDRQAGRQPPAQDARQAEVRHRKRRVHRDAAAAVLRRGSAVDRAGSGRAASVSRLRENTLTDAPLNIVAEMNYGKPDTAQRFDTEPTDQHCLEYLGRQPSLWVETKEKKALLASKLKETLIFPNGRRCVELSHHAHLQCCLQVAVLDVAGGAVGGSGGPI